jgi:hypothetical protein
METLHLFPERLGDRMKVSATLYIYKFDSIHFHTEITLKNYESWKVMHKVVKVSETLYIHKLDSIHFRTEVILRSYESWKVMYEVRDFYGT